MGQKLTERLLVEPGKSVKLSEWDPEADYGWSREEAEAETDRNLERMSDLQEKLWASRKNALLAVLPDHPGHAAARVHRTAQHIPGRRVVVMNAPIVGNLARPGYFMVDGEADGWKHHDTGHRHNHRRERHSPEVLDQPEHQIGLRGEQ